MSERAQINHFSQLDRVMTPTNILNSTRIISNDNYNGSEKQSKYNLQRGTAVADNLLDIAGN